MLAPILDHEPGLFAPGRRHLFVLAHHDDEVPYAGVIARTRPELRMLWTTNSDGLAYLDGTDEAAYAELRWHESVSAMACLDVPEPRLACLGHSEVELYALFAEMSEAPGEPLVPPRFGRIADEVEAEVRRYDPHVVWTMAWQGGHPEHDLTHLAAVRAAGRLGADRGEPVPVYELPAYELMIVPLRFKPWRRDPLHEIHLTTDEQAIKLRMLGCYPTQEPIIRSFRRVIGVYGHLARLAGRAFTFEDYGARETFARVPPDRDYGRSTHLSPRLDYPGDDFRGRPVRFEKTLPPIARSLGMA